MQQLENSNVTSLSLIDQARQRDPDAWRRLCQIYAPLVYSWVRKAGVPENDAADVVQEIFRIVALHIERFRHDRPEDTFRGWLITITRTEVLVYFRRRSKQVAFGEGGSSAMVRLQTAAEGNAVDLNSQAWQDDSTDAQIVRRAAELVRQDFEPHTWQAFWRSVVEGHDVGDIATDLQMTPNAIRQARFRILTRLRETLAE